MIRRRGQLAGRLVVAWLLAGAMMLALGVAHAALAAGGTFTQYRYSGLAGSRPYYVYTPVKYDGEPVPLVVMLHGCSQDPLIFASDTRMNELADTERFIVVYPQQTVTADAGRCWHWYLPTSQSRGSGEPAIIAGITQAVIADWKWNIDLHRVYLAGFSAGAAMAVIMGATYPDLFAAIGEESGLEYGAASDGTSAQTALLLGGPSPDQQGRAAYAAMGAQARVVPVITFHGTSDTRVSTVNGDQVVQQWMATDQLASQNAYKPNFASPSSTQLGTAGGLQGRAYTTRRWTDMAGRVIQEYWTIAGMGHAWSGGPSGGSFTDPLGPSATDNMYAFFIGHPN
jgi:poly(hydroxyalkanoate) depolymerase family esterase